MYGINQGLVGDKELPPIAYRLPVGDMEEFLITYHLPVGDRRYHTIAYRLPLGDKALIFNIAYHLSPIAYHIR